MNTRQPLLIVDDDEDVRTQMKWAMASDYDVVVAEDRAGATLAFRKHRPIVTLLDLGLPPRPNDPFEGMATLSTLVAIDARARVIVMTGQGERENALRAVGSGAYDFLQKPVDLDQLKLVVSRCAYVAGIEQEYATAKDWRPEQIFEDMVGASPPIRAVFAIVRKVAPTTAPVLILGDSGTGKEMVARAIHRRSGQRAGPFVAINCNAIPENLLESELFGHEKGAFTGAHLQRKGHIESAAGGTLFLDEIGELPLAVQVKLLRFLQDRTFQRVGGRVEMQSDARVIAATNADLAGAVAAGKFREDLYFRLAVVVIKVPPLRERGGDIALLAAEFLRRYSAQHGRSHLSLTPDAVGALNMHDWSGNVRELQNRLQRAVIMADGKRITAVDLELAAGDSETQAPTLRKAREDVEREVVQKALHRSGGRITSAAHELGISRPTLYELMEKLGIRRDD